MNKIRIWSWLVCLMLPICYVQAQDTHWQCDIYSYQYDMTVYPELQLDGQTIKASANYELAAFCGEECRGVATVEIIPGTDKTYYYLRVRSNASEGETITFKFYHTATRQEVTLNESITFESQAMQGLPSEPYALTGENTVMLGDVNGDGKITNVDFMGMMNYLLRRSMSFSFLEAAADLNSDGKITNVDFMKLMNILLRR
ncbi:MAG: hypothetical protein IJ467_01780 [Bacteroidaceae bacterium]|nr:hypothetical protein [Bacteroidaceae bacterium]